MRMTDFIKMNGVAVRTNSFNRRNEIAGDGIAHEIISASIIVRGSMQHRSLSELLSQSSMRLEIPNGATMDLLEVDVVESTHVTTGLGEGSAYRHDVRLRETDSSAVRRASHAAATQAMRSRLHPVEQAQHAPVEEEPSDDRLDRSWDKLSSDQSTWMNAIKQMKDPDALKPAVPEPPLTAAELSGIEAVLVGLRLEALIAVLDEAGAIRRSDIDDYFHHLVMERFINEASPVVGEKAARRAVKELIEI
jgi:hypothetical protein